MIAESLTSEIKKPTDLNEEEISRWQEIQSKTSHLQKAFLSFHFCCSVSESHPLASGCIIREGGKIVAFFPFQFKDRFHEKIKVAERIGGELNDYFGLVAESGFHITMKQLCRLADINFMHYSHLDLNQKYYGFPVNSLEKGLLIRIGDSSDQYFNALRKKNKKIVSDTARRERKIEKEIGQLHFTFNVDAEHRRLLLDEIIQRKRKQYYRSGAKDSLAEEWTRMVLQVLARIDEPLCRGILSTLYAGNTWIAAHFGLQCCNVLHFWFPVYNREMRQYSPGRLLLKRIIENSPLLENPVSIIDRGAGISKTKLDFANDEHVYLRDIIYRRNFLGFMYRLYCSVKWRL